WTQKDCRSVAATLATVLVLEHDRATSCRGLVESARIAQRIDGAARQARRKYKIFSRRADRARPKHQTRSASDRPDHDWRRSEVAEIRRADAGERRLRDRLFLSRRAARHRTCADAGVRCAFP